MKKIFVVLLLTSIWSCSNNTNTSNKNDTTNATYNEEKPDTSVHPNGLNNSSVTSTDTSAYRVPDTSKNK
jgi:hypothetical protein